MWVVPKTVIEAYPNPKISPLGHQKVKNDPKIESKSKVGIEGIKEDKSFSTTWIHPKTVLSPHPTPKIAHKGPKKSKITPKLSQNQKLELKKT